MYPAGFLLLALGIGLGAGMALAWAAFAFRRWVRDEVRAESRRAIDALVGHAQDVVRVQQATTPPPPDVLQDIFMELGKRRSEDDETLERFKHYMNGGNWNDTPAQRAMYKKEKPPKKH